jgi:TldD protein
VELLDAKAAPGGRQTVILSPSIVGLLVHEAIGHTVEADFVLSGSVAQGKIGHKVASELVTLCDSGRSEYFGGAGGTLPVDDEGVVADRTVVIEQGILKGYLHNRETAARFGVAPTGNARAWEYADTPLVRMRNTYIAAGPHSPEDLIASIDQGLYCKSMGGGSVGPTGQFNFAVEEGFLIENGQLTRPVKGATLIGEAKEVMPRISMCANDLELAAGFCGSVSGSINVTVGQPHIKVDAITVGGR